MRKISVVLLIYFVFQAGALYSQDTVPQITRQVFKKIEVDDEHINLSEPEFICYDGNQDLLYVVNHRGNGILVYTDSLEYVRTIGRFGQGPGEFISITALSVARNGNLVVMDRTRVQVLSPDGTYISGFNVIHRAIGFPLCSVMSNEGNVFVPIITNDKLITVYTAEGERLTAFGELCDTGRSYNGVQRTKQDLDNRIHLRIDSEDNLYSVFYNMPLIRKYDTSLQLVSEFNYRDLECMKLKKKYGDINWKKDRNQPGTYSFIGYFNNVDLGDEYIYLNVHTGSHPLLVVDKVTGLVVRRYKIMQDEQYSFDFNSFAVHGTILYAANKYMIGMVKLGE